MCDLIPDTVTNRAQLRILNSISIIVLYNPYDYTISKKTKKKERRSTKDEAIGFINGDLEKEKKMSYKSYC